MTIYQNNIPQSGDVLSESQSDIQFNHIAENAIFGEDHFRFNAPKHKGKHQSIKFQDQNDGSGGGQPSTDSEEIALYAFRNRDDINDPHRINLRARYQDDGDDAGVVPFSGGVIGFHPGSAPFQSFIIGNGVNIDIPNTVVNPDEILTVRFGVPTANSDYFLWLQPAFVRSTGNAFAAKYFEQTQGGFRVRLPAGKNIANITFSFMVFEN